MGNTVLALDKREILAVHKAGDYQTEDFQVGRHGVTKIESYQEHGEYDYLPFVAVYKGDFLAVRVPAMNLTIHYKEKTSDHPHE
jgi:hypothetical protein